MSTFKIGDRVRVKCGKHAGLIGTLLDDDASPWVGFDVVVDPSYSHYGDEMIHMSGYPHDRTKMFWCDELERYLDSDKPLATGDGKHTTHLLVQQATRNTALQQLLNDLRAEGFGSDDPIDGANVIDIINHHWDALNGNGE